MVQKLTIKKVNSFLQTDALSYNILGNTCQDQWLMTTTYNISGQVLAVTHLDSVCWLLVEEMLLQ
jgi:hypothetical protein